MKLFAAAAIVLLSLVSSLLSMQARGAASDEVRAALATAEKMAERILARLTTA